MNILLWEVYQIIRKFVLIKIYKVYLIYIITRTKIILQKSINKIWFNNG